MRVNERFRRRRAQRLAKRRATLALPDDAWSYGRAGCPLPQDDRFALIGDADCGQRRTIGRNLGGKDLVDDFADACPNRQRILFDPGRLWVGDGEGARRLTHDPAVVIEQDGFSIGCALVNGEHKSSFHESVLQFIVCTAVT